MIGSKEKKERTLSVRLHLKAERCLGQKCVLVRRPTRPGVHGKKRQRRALSDFGRQIREKQKFKVSYGLDEGNLRTLYEKASRRRGDVAVGVLELLERRLDNVLYRLGLAASRGVARQLIVQGHIMVNGKGVRAPGYTVKPEDRVGIRPASRAKGPFQDLPAKLKGVELPEWLALDPAGLEGRVLSMPGPVELPFEINLLVESFSK